VVAAEQDRPDIARKRCRWKAHQHRVDPRRLVFLDETWVKTNMAPLRGWGPGTVRNFVRRLGMIGAKEPDNAATQRTSDT